MIRKVDHVTMVVKNVDEAVKKFEKILHITPEGGAIRDLPPCRLAMLSTPAGARIELIEPKAKVKTRMSEFFKKHGEGVFGLSVFIDDFDNEVKTLKKNGVTVEEEIQAAVHPGYPLKLGWIPPEQSHGI